MALIGDLSYGGIIFYVDETGEHGLVSATVDQGMTSWGLSIEDKPNVIFQQNYQLSYCNC